LSLAYATSATSELRFPLAWLALPHPSVDPHLRELLELEAKAELERLPERATYGARVRELVRPQLNEAEPTLEAVASRMRMSARTLQRYLKEEGTTFQREIDELRRTVAEHLLREGRASLAEIACELGFADQSAFHKAFVRWTGRTPGDFRRG
jgi:AraC-like DNA-binding protein